MDKLNSITSFVEVARTRSFTQAAEHLGLSRLQVSRHIQDIEKWLNLRLFHRTTRKVSLTIQGEEALSYCQQILNQVSDLQSRAHSHNNELVGTIRLASPIGLGQHKLFDAIEAFTKRHPHTRFELLLSDSLSQLVDDRVDIALRYIHQPDEGLIARKLMYIATAVCASKAYLTQHDTISDPNDLATHNCLVHKKHSVWQFQRNGNTKKVTVKGNIVANDMGVLLKAAKQGMGIAHLPCDLANDHLLSGELIKVLPEYTTVGSHIWAVYLSRNFQQNVVRAFIDFLAELWHHDIL